MSHPSAIRHPFMLFLAPEGCLISSWSSRNTRLGKEYALILVHPYPVIPTLGIVGIFHPLRLSREEACTRAFTEFMTSCLDEHNPFPHDILCYYVVKSRTHGASTMLKYSLIPVDRWKRVLSAQASASIILKLKIKNQTAINIVQIIFPLPLDFKAAIKNRFNTILFYFLIHFPSNPLPKKMLAHNYRKVVD